MPFAAYGDATGYDAATTARLAGPPPRPALAADARSEGYALPVRRDLLDAGRDAWEALRDFRIRRARCREYYRGRQQGDLVVDPDTGERIPAARLIEKQGRVPISNNEVGALVRNLKGQLSLNQSQPEPFPVDQDDAEAADMASTGLRAAFASNGMKRLESAQFEELLLSGTEVYRVRYGWLDAIRRCDVCIDPVNPARFFFNPDASDPRLSDVTILGEICDIPFEEVVHLFATDPEAGTYDAAKAAALARVYKSQQHAARWGRIGADTRPGANRLDGLGFLDPMRPEDCRVIYVWRREYLLRAYVEDYETGHVGPLARPADGEAGLGAATYAEAAMEAEILNAQRIEAYYAAQEAWEAGTLMIAEAAGVGLASPGGLVPPPMPPGLCRAVERYEPVWMGYALAPGGELLWSAPSPWRHGEHPYCFGVTVRVDGETWGLVEDVIDPQRMYNRINTAIDHLFGAGGKGPLVYDKRMVNEDEYTDADVADNWTRFDGVMGVEPPDGRTVGDFAWQPNPRQVPPFLLEWMDRYAERIRTQSGVNPAAMGEVPTAGMPAAGYHLQQVASSTNTRDIFDCHFFIRRGVGLKALALQLQYYDEPRQLRLSSRARPVLFDPARVRDLEWDIALADVGETATSALVWEQDLQTFLTGQHITFEEYLELSGHPKAPTLLRLVRERQAALGWAAGGPMDLLGMPAVAPGLPGGGPAADLAASVMGSPSGGSQQERFAP